MTLRHALRVAIVCGVALLVAAFFHLKHGYWIPMTAVVVMRPYLGATWKRSLERTLGSAAGGILAAALTFFVRSKIGLALLLFPMSFAALAALPVSYALFVVFLTPTFVIASLPYAGNWQLAAVRAMDSILGAALALPAMYGLWPLWQHEGFRQRLADCFQADVDYFTTIERSWREPAGISPVEIARARRQGGLSNNAAEDALDQLLDEPKTNLKMREAASSFVTYMRRLAQTVTAIHNHPPQKRCAADFNRLSDLTASLNNIVQGLRTGHIELRAGGPFVAGNEKATDQLDVIERQIYVLENAAQSLAKTALPK